MGGLQAAELDWSVFNCRRLSRCAKGVEVAEFHQWLIGRMVLHSLSGFGSKLKPSRGISIESLPIRQFSSSVCEAVVV